jgi:hypothetical protein
MKWLRRLLGVDSDIDDVRSRVNGVVDVMVDLGLARIDSKGDVYAGPKWEDAVRGVRGIGFHPKAPDQEEVE